MSTSPAPEAPTYDDVVAAAEQIAGHAVITPLLESRLGVDLISESPSLNNTPVR